MKKMVVIRRLSQAFFLCLFVYVLWSTTYPLTGIISPDLLFKADPLIMIITSVSERIIVPGIALSLGMIVLTVLFGRFFCGWVCPLGATIDFAGSVRKKKKILSDTKNAALRRVKLYVLGMIFLASLLGRQIAWIFDPVVIMGRFVSLNFIPSVTFAINSFFIILIRDLGVSGAVKDLYHALKPALLGVKVFYFSHAIQVFLVFLTLSVAAIFLQRFWCRVFCPLGSLYALLGAHAPLGRTVKGCTRCGKCKSHCRMGAIRDDLSYVRGECILCMDCIYNCPDRLTSFTFAKK